MTEETSIDDDGQFFGIVNHGEFTRKREIHRLPGGWYNRQWLKTIRKLYFRFGAVVGDVPSATAHSLYLEWKKRGMVILFFDHGEEGINQRLDDVWRNPMIEDEVLDLWFEQKPNPRKIPQVSDDFDPIIPSFYRREKGKPLNDYP